MFHIQINDELFIRMLSGRDAKDLFQLTDGSRNYLKQWLPWVDATKEENDSMEFIQHTLKGYEQRISLTAGIFYQNGLVGVIGYNTLDFSNKIGSIGYWLGEQYQNKGIMTTAVRAVISYGFDNLQLNRIEIQCATENKKSQHIPERLGFTKEGCLKQSECLYNRFVDHYLYRMLAEEWEDLSTEKSENY